MEHKQKENQGVCSSSAGCSQITHHYFLDILRIAACFLVIVNHSNSGIFQNAVPGSLVWVLSFAYFSISKTAVGIFLMISGYLLLAQPCTWEKNWRRIRRMVIVLFCWSVLYALFKMVIYYPTVPAELTIERILLFYQFLPSDALWYLYAYLGILIMLPYLHKMTQTMEKRDYHIFFAVSGMVVCVLPFFGHYSRFAALQDSFQLPLFAGNILLLLLGRYFSQFGVLRTKGRKFTALLLLSGMILTNVLAAWMEISGGSENGYRFLDSYLLFPAVISAVCIFYLSTFVPISAKAGKLLKYIGDKTFGIYLVADMLLTLTESVAGKIYVGSGIWQIPSIFVYQMIVFLTGLAITAWMKKIPLVKAIV